MKSSSEAGRNASPLPALLAARDLLSVQPAGRGAHVRLHVPALRAAGALLRVEPAGAVLHIRLHRPAKRNAINDRLVAQLHTAFVNLPEVTRAVVLSGEGEHFCAGLDLSELTEHSAAEGI